jgi:hypothetical protein
MGNGNPTAHDRGEVVVNISGIPIEDYEVYLSFISDVKCHGGQKWFAKQNGFSTSYINDVYNGRRAITEKLGNVLGYKLERKWVRK